MLDTFITCNFLHKFLVTSLNMFNLSDDDNEISVATETVPTIKHTSVESWERTLNIMGCVSIADRRLWFPYGRTTTIHRRGSQMIADDCRK